jgi:predicted DNA-binding transcriptional regulator AlpA
MSAADTPRRIYGIAEIANELGVRRETVAQWHNRNQLPKPDEQLGMGPAWLAETLRPWLDSKKAQIAAKALMSTNLGMIVWFLILGGLLWANFSTRKTFDEACASDSPAEIERATCRYGTVLEASEKLRSSRLGSFGGSVKEVISGQVLAQLGPDKSSGSKISCVDGNHTSVHRTLGRSPRRMSWSEACSSPEYAPAFKTGAPANPGGVGSIPIRLRHCCRETWHAPTNVAALFPWTV